MTVPSPFSVVIPTRDRSRQLAATLAAYSALPDADLVHEIIIADDGSSDDTAETVARFSSGASFPVVYLHQDGNGPAEARNAGIRRASGTLLLLTGDDIVPAGGFLRERCATHAQHGFAGRVAVLGHTDWPPDAAVTPFLRYINDYGLQFGYKIMPNPDDLPFTFFYTSNISIGRAFLLEDSLFHPGFPYAGWEDIELGYRLSKRGLRIVYNERARGYHHHAMSFSSFRDRQWRCGYAAGVLHRMHPELKHMLDVGRARRNPLGMRLYSRAAELFCLTVDRRLSVPFPRLYEAVMRRHYWRGLRAFLDGGEGYPPGKAERPPDAMF